MEKIPEPLQGLLMALSTLLVVSLVLIVPYLVHRFVWIKRERKNGPYAGMPEAIRQALEQRDALEARRRMRNGKVLKIKQGQPAKPKVTHPPHEPIVIWFEGGTYPFNIVL